MGSEMCIRDSAYAGVIDATSIDVEIIHFSFHFFFDSRFRKRGSSILRRGVLGHVASVESGFLSLARLLWYLQSRSIVVTLKFPIEWLK